eukprot:NODE_4770_length_1021_cov_47.879733_g4565_i0.p2 GENE.NODE_4770_length_1021_cov_47.879733_g4565_i0~~NODE_4770_length_1021_cov_47.879733_g4565_i0.p2  ORF type:complete len:290 (-),score=75.71 NODE_4770_length_1021_cov_47.879733_g4565_i0:82-951(-)
MADVRPGDWTCASCGNNNFARRTDCHKCAAPKEGGMGGGMGGGGGGGGNTDVRPGDWTCPSCGNNCFSRRMDCNRCGTPKAGVMGGGMGMIGGGGMGMMGGMGGGMGGGGGNTDMRPGDWLCGSCGNNCFARRMECNRCGSPRAGGMGGGMMGGMGGGMGMMGGGMGMMGGGMGMMGGGMGMMGGGMGGQNITRPGDWTCPGCGNNCFSYRTDCKKCGSARPEGAGSPGAMRGAGSQNQPFMPGDWHCSDAACGNLNFARRMECHKCGKAKSADAGGMSNGAGGRFTPY